MKLDKYLTENEEDVSAVDQLTVNTGFKFTPEQIKNLKIYVLGMENDVRHITLKRGIIKLNSNKPLNAEEAGSVKDFCLDVLSGNSSKFKALWKRNFLK